MDLVRTSSDLLEAECYMHSPMKQEEEPEPEPEPITLTAEEVPEPITLTAASELEDVALFLKSIKRLSKDYSPLVVKENLLGEVMLEVTETDLKDFGVAVFGDRKLIMKAISSCKESQKS